MPKFSARKLKNVVLDSAGWKIFFSTIIPILSGVFSGSFISEITKNNTILWHDFYTSISFYILLIICTISYFYFKSVYIHERSIEKFLDDDYCRAYMRSKCLPEAAEKYKESIRTGNGGELTNAMRELERVLR
ncbi:hypothetical protein [Pseudomonas tohonis]|uniref:hypothetical protein n=1 Tax=Pseudomonas tohonis TaxID=2725477 RepID=UPI001F3418FF|nr:hypothetical protein [Pseudomonas tohonis]